MVIATQAEPLVHHVHLAEHVAAGDLYGDRAEQQDGRVEPQDGRNGSGEPAVDVVGVGVEVGCALGHEEDADDRHKEHEDRGQAEEQAEAQPVEALARPGAGTPALVGVVSVAAAAGPFVGGRAPASAVVAVVEFAASSIGIRGCADDRHEGS
jgi:hypothetical protein